MEKSMVNPYPIKTRRPSACRAVVLRLEGLCGSHPHIQKARKDHEIALSMTLQKGRKSKCLEATSQQIYLNHDFSINLSATPIFFLDLSSTTRHNQFPVLLRQEVETRGTTRLDLPMAGLEQTQGEGFAVAVTCQSRLFLVC